MNITYIQKGSDAKKDILSVYGIMNKHFPDIQFELKEVFKRDWAERQGEQEYIPSTAMFKAYEQDMEFVCMDTLATAGTTIKAFLAYLQGAEFSFYSEYHNRGFRCRYVGYDSKAFYREAQDVVVFNVKVKINNPLSYAIPSTAITGSTSVTTTGQTGVGKKWTGVAANSTNGHIYACTGTDGDIYKQTSGTGIFAPLNATGASKNWQGVSVNSTTGDVYACTLGDGIYKQTAGSGNFVLQTTGVWGAISVNKATADVFACIYMGAIYKQTAGTGAWNAVNTTISEEQWRSVTVNSANGDVYACHLNGDIYKQTAGVGSFVALNATGAIMPWGGIVVNTVTSDVYACNSQGYIYKQTAGSGDFVELTASGIKNWLGLSIGVSNNVHACVYLGDIYKQTAGTGNFTALIVAITQTTTTTVSSGSIITCTANSPTVIYWDDSTPTTYLEAAGDSTSKSFAETGHFAIVCPQKL